MLSRYCETDELTPVNRSEVKAILKISAQLDKALVEPFMDNYSELLAEAQKRLGDEGE
jgi:hypothetical protein